MNNEKLLKNEITNQLEDTKEFVEMYGKLTLDERKQVKGILIGMTLVRETEKNLPNYTLSF